MKLFSKLPLITVIFLNIVLLFVGCSLNKSVYRYTAPCGEFDHKPVVAVLTFQNLSEWDGAEKIIENLFTSELIKEGYPVVEPANVKKMYVTSKLSDKSTAITRIIDLLAAQFNAQYFITGTVINYSYIINGNKSVPLVSFNVRMLDWNKEIALKAHVENKGTESEVVFTLGEIRTPDRLASLSIRKLVSKFCLSNKNRSWS